MTTETYFDNEHQLPVWNMNMCILNAERNETTESACNYTKALVISQALTQLPLGIEIGWINTKKVVRD